jgi:hypothetical protein
MVGVQSEATPCRRDSFFKKPIGVQRISQKLHMRQLGAPPPMKIWEPIFATAVAPSGDPG